MRRSVLAARATRLTCTLAASIVLAWAGWAWAVEPGRPAPDVVLQTAQGQRVALADIAAQVIVVDVWASWCAPCKRELPELDRAIVGLGPQVHLVALSVDEDPAEAVRAFEALHLTHARLYVDPQGSVAGAFAPDTMPTTYVIGPDRRVHLVAAGYEPGQVSRIAAQIRALLPPPPERTASGRGPATPGSPAQSGPTGATTAPGGAR